MNTKENVLQLEDLKLRGLAEFYKSMQTMPAKDWSSVDIINEPTIANAIMDRLTAGDVHRIELKGESLRRKKQK